MTLLIVSKLLGAVVLVVRLVSMLERKTQRQNLVAAAEAHFQPLEI
jgi:hypothetical protein